jgi:hypothetical protein
MKAMRIAAALSSVIAAAACSKSSETPPPRSASMEQASPESMPPEQTTRSTPPATEPAPGAPTTTLPDRPMAGTAEPTPSGGSAPFSPNAVPPTSPSVGGGPTTPSVGGGPTTSPDRNVNDVNEGAMSSQHPGGNDADQLLADKIRAALSQDSSLSASAKNVDISIASGKVTLRGNVKSQAEKKAIEAKARDIAGAAEVESRLKVKK